VAKPPIGYHILPAHIDGSTYTTEQLVEWSKMLIRHSTLLCQQGRELANHSHTARKSGEVLRQWHLTRGIVKVCSCGIEYLPSEWMSLNLVGYQTYGRKLGEMRNCRNCGTTLLLITKK